MCYPAAGLLTSISAIATPNVWSKAAMHCQGEASWRHQASQNKEWNVYEVVMGPSKGVSAANFLQNLNASLHVTFDLPQAPCTRRHMAACTIANTNQREGLHYSQNISISLIRKTLTVAAKTNTFELALANKLVGARCHWFDFFLKLRWNACVQWAIQGIQNGWPSIFWPLPKIDLTLASFGHVNSKLAHLNSKQKL